MHLTKLTIENVRSITKFEYSVSPNEAPGWHVILGDNGSGKSSVIRSIALLFSGGKHVSATRQTWNEWLRSGTNEATISATLNKDDEDQFKIQGPRVKSFSASISLNSTSDQLGRSNTEISFPGKQTTTKRTIWSPAVGWFSASFGPFRRFSGGDRDWERLFLSSEYRRAAGHLSAFGEDVALTEAFRWLQQLHIASLEKQHSQSEQIRDLVRDFVNNSELLPHGAKISEITSQNVTLKDGDGNIVLLEQMSDGYRSILSLTFELLRQMFEVYGNEIMISNIDSASSIVSVPGVVAIDEVDAHLHPTWQARIGDWFLAKFPKIQFIVTTHSPIICRAAKKGSIWKMPTPGGGGEAFRVTGVEEERLISGNILEAYSTDFFGKDIERSADSEANLARLSKLAKRKATGKITKEEETELESIRAAMPTEQLTIEQE
ncbi:Predicted ATP-binding protein involved in virulence [Methylobacterium sp. 174MFSha1.1]|uniref:AAA family ATPase n=1 Tax=Methylobacterium sp. 174MFSha1.1 TaxID=1502749 RepID=UPI0008E49BD1|nr:ATP-binding protein [Methylobacterium sp. 174MFSha1.1]SFV10990.1 Predicted ATP-binding protein involved in virulence [Methylobacterium sp. 174MFSha1.1]